jgi:hypothetical protein
VITSEDFGGSESAIILMIKSINDWRMFFPLDRVAAVCDVECANRRQAVGGQQHKFRG